MRKFNATLGAAMIAACLISAPVHAQTSLEELQDLPPAKYSDVDAQKGFNKKHWAYQTLENFSSKYGVLVGSSTKDFDGDRPLTRSEAAVILVNLVGKINKDEIKLSVGERAQLDILRNELKKETQALVGRVASLEGRVSNLEQEDDHTLRTRMGKDFKFIGAAQMKYTDNVSHGVNSSGDITKASDNFSIPTVCPVIKGKLSDKVGVYLGVNLARSIARDSTSDVDTQLLDAYVSSSHIPNHTVYFGQTRVPTGVEGATSPYSLDFVERAMLASNFANHRDIGIKVAGKYKYVDYYTGVYNGNPYGTSDEGDTGTDFAFWANLKPLAGVEGYGDLVLGSGYTTGAKAGSYDVFGGYLSYKLGKFGVKTEYSIADGYSGSASNSAIKADGYYVTTSYNLTDTWQLLGRYDQFDANRLVHGDSTNEYTVGVNKYFMDKHMKLQVNYVYEDLSDSANDTSRFNILAQYVM